MPLSEKGSATPTNSFLSSTDKIFIRWPPFGIPKYTGYPPKLSEFVIYRSEDNGGLGEIGRTAAHAFLDDNDGDLLTPGKAYTYEVVGITFDAVGNILSSHIVFGPESFETLGMASSDDDEEPPTAPKEYEVRGENNDLRHKWIAAIDKDSGLLGTFVQDRVDGHAIAFLPEDATGTTVVDRWRSSVADEAEYYYQLQAIDKALNVSVPCPMKGAGAKKKGWTVYRFGGSKSPFEFKLKKNCTVKADALIIGGGGSGGGGLHGGGGGAGGFVDLHNLLIVSDAVGAGIIFIPRAHTHFGDDKYQEPIPWDWKVVVGSGGKTVLFTDAVGNTGEDSSIGGTLDASGKAVGGIVAYGGGYGGRVGGINNYVAGAGASGGGAMPYEELYYLFWGGRNQMYKGFGGHANNNWEGDKLRYQGRIIRCKDGGFVWDENGPLPPDRPIDPAHWDSPKKPCGRPEDGPPIGEVASYSAIRAGVMLGSYNPYQPQGHYGADALASGSWLQHTCGGGGGANWGGYSGGGGGIGSMANNAPNGGLGRPCDIEGYGKLYAQTNVDGLGIKMINWFCGGGAGKERPNNWSYPDGQPGYGGGGQCGVPGMVNTGGGGGGHGWLGSSSPGWGVPGYTGPDLSGKAPGPAGGRGVVIIRIPTSSESLVEYPIPIGYRDGVDPVTEEKIQIPIYPSGIRVTHVPEDQPHIDAMGDESVAIYAFPIGGWQDEDGNTWDAPVHGWCHYGFDGSWYAMYNWRYVVYPPPRGIVGDVPDDAGGRMDPSIPEGGGPGEQYDITFPPNAWD